MHISIYNRPKGVMLTHGNLLHQIQLRFAPSKKYDVSEPMPGDVMVRHAPCCLVILSQIEKSYILRNVILLQVTILPVWHITERAAELCMFSRGCTLVYSNVKNLKSDLR